MQVPSIVYKMFEIMRVRTILSEIRSSTFAPHLALSARILSLGCNGHENLLNHINVGVRNTDGFTASWSRDMSSSLALHYVTPEMLPNGL